MNTKLDLRPLALDREASRSPTTVTHRKSRWISRYVIPLVVLLGFVALLLAVAGNRWLPVRSVSVVPVIVKRAEFQSVGTPLFTAPGWVEPRPTAVNVPALAAGIVEQLFVVEGESVECGQPIARLIDVDAELAVEQAKAVLAIREGELNRVLAEHKAAKIRFEQPVHLEAELADADSALAVARTELGNLPRLIEKAQAELTYAEQSLEGKRNAGFAVAGIVLRRAEADYTTAQATLQELQEREPNLRRNVAALERKSQSLRQQLQLLVEERRQLGEAEARVETATAMRAEAGLALQQADLKLKRMVITAPISGRVLRLVAAPGDRVMGLDSTAEHRSSTVVQMYDPTRLQVRVDVRLEDVPRIVPGQPVEVETASSRDPIRGQVLRATSSANIQKNTLEVKVELIDPSPSVTPEMLVTATFLAPETQDSTTASSEKERLFVPAELITTMDIGKTVWIVDPSNRAQLRSVEIGSTLDSGLIEITSGLKVTDKLISSGGDGLTSGTRVKVEGDDQRFGM